MAPRLPNRAQSTISTVLLLCLSLALAPISFILSTFFSLTHRQSRRSHGRQRTVLINGARMQKSLAACRTFARNGWRVVLVEERGWGNLAAPRFSNSVSAFHLLPPASEAGRKPGERELPYVKALVDVALLEKADLFFPCSGAGTTGLDALAAQILLQKTRGKVRSIVQTPELVETLHEKDRFISLLQKLDMAAPRSEIVTSVDEAIAKLQSKDFPRSILKCAAELNDVGRSDMTLYPLSNQKTGRADWAQTKHRLMSLSIPICARTPYILQEFIGDRPNSAAKASEWCTHATVVDGKLTAFVCCPSNDMLMTYYPASHTIVGEIALRWTSTFLYRLQKAAESGELPQWSRESLVGRHAPSSAGITGHFSMDFIYQPSTSDGQSERLVAIECNPRVHTAICLLVGHPALGDALVPAALSSSAPSLRSHMQNGHKMPADEVEYLSSLALPVMETPPAVQIDQPDFAAIAPSWATSRARFYHARNGIQEAYANEQASRPLSWIGHDLPARLVPALCPPSTPLIPFILSTIHPLWTLAAPQSHRVLLPSSSTQPLPPFAKDGASPQLPTSTLFDLSASASWPPFTDPAFAKDDPWPFFALYHLQWPQLLLWQLVVRQKKWSRINVSTARIFEC